MPLFEYEEIDQLTKEDLPVYKIPKSIQQTIDITAIAKNGVFCHTPKKRKRGEKASYSKAYRFEDVPFATLDEEEKEGKILSWCKFLNFHQTEDYKKAMEYYRTLENDLEESFRRFGSKLTAMDAIDRLKSLHDFYRMGKEEEFQLTWDEIKKGKNYLNTICNVKLSYKEDFIEDEGKFSRVLFVKDFPSGLLDNFVRDIMDLSQHLTFTVDVIPVPKEVSAKFVANKLMGVEGDISKQQRQRNKRGEFSTDITWEKRQEHDEVESVLNSLQKMDQEMFYTSVTIITTADTKKELESNTLSLINAASRFGIVLETLYCQQREGLNTALPIGVRQIKTLRAMLTNGVASLVPFSTQEMCQEGCFYGVNQISKNIVRGDRKNLQNPHGFVFGTSGSGKSFFNKGEIVQTFIGSEDDFFLLDPKNEYRDVCQLMKGEFLNITSSSDIYVNPFEVNMEELKRSPEKVIGGKVDLAYGICQQATMGNLSGVDCSLIDRAVRMMYGAIISGAEKEQRTMVDFAKELERMPEKEAQTLNLSIERFVSGSLDIFSHQSNVDMSSRVVGFGLADLGEALRGMGLLITLEHIKARIKKNYKLGKATRIYIDEIHNLLLDPFSAGYLQKFWKEYRQYMGICTGITQNVDTVLRSEEGKEMLANSEFVYLAKQAPTDRETLLRTVDITNAQLSYVTNSEYGQGLLKFGKNIMPLNNYLDRKNGTEAEKKLYQLYNTNSFEEIR